MAALGEVEARARRRRGRSEYAAIRAKREKDSSRVKRGKRSGVSWTGTPRTRRHFP
jgi:hypothetical protein